MHSVLAILLAAVSISAQRVQRPQAKANGPCGLIAPDCKENCQTSICPIPYYCKTNPHDKNFKDDGSCSIDYDCPGTCQLFTRPGSQTPEKCPSKVEIAVPPRVVLPAKSCGEGYGGCGEGHFCRMDPFQNVNRDKKIGVCVRYQYCGGMRPRMSECMASRGPQGICEADTRCIDAPLGEGQDPNSSCGMACDAPGICAPTDWPCGEGRPCPFPLTCAEMDEKDPRKQRAGWPEKGQGFCV